MRAVVSTALLLPTLALLVLARDRQPQPRDDHNHDHANGPLRSNMILMLLDDVGYGDLDYGDGTHTSPSLTPHIADMAQGRHTVHFERFYSAAPICAPSRSSMLTGRTPSRECIINVEQNSLPPPMSRSTTAAYARSMG